MVSDWLLRTSAHPSTPQSGFTHWWWVMRPFSLDSYNQQESRIECRTVTRLLFKNIARFSKKSVSWQHWYSRISVVLNTGVSRLGWEVWLLQSAAVPWHSLKENFTLKQIKYVCIEKFLMNLASLLFSSHFQVKDEENERESELYRERICVRVQGREKPLRPQSSSTVSCSWKCQRFARETHAAPQNPLLCRKG